MLACFRLVARQARDARTVLTGLDAEATEVCGADDFVTAVVGQVTDGHLPLVNAGHPAHATLGDDVALLAVEVPTAAGWAAHGVVTHSGGDQGGGRSGSGDGRVLA